MRCLVCHTRVPRLRAWRTKSEFCSDEHAETYKQQTLARLFDERDPPSAVDLPLPAHEILEEEQAPSSVSAPSSTEASVETYQQPETPYPAEAGPVLIDEPRQAYAREDEGRVGDQHEREAAEEARIAAEEHLSASQEREDKLIPSFSQLEATEPVTGLDPFERLALLVDEELAKLPSSTVDVELSESEDVREEIAAVRGEQKESGALDAPESTPGREESPAVLEQDEGETEQLGDIRHLLGAPEQDQTEARKPEQVVKDTDLVAHFDGDPQWAQVQGEPPIGEEALISATPQSSEEDEVRAPVSADKTDPGPDALLDILNRPSGSRESVELDSTEPDVDQSVKADSESSWSANECRPYTELVSIDELVHFAPDLDDETREMLSRGSNPPETASSRPEDALGVERPPLVPEPPRALATDSSFGSVPHAPLTHPRTFEAIEPFSGSNQAYRELRAGAPRATAPVTPQQAAPLTLGSPNLQGDHLASLWPAAAEGVNQQSKGLDVELRSEPYSRLAAGGSRQASVSTAPSQAFSLQPFLRPTGKLCEISCESSEAIADEQESRPVHSGTAAEEKPPTIRAVVGSSPAPILLAAAPQGTVSTRELLPESVDLGSTHATPTSLHEESLDAFGPLWTASLAPPHRAMQLKTSYVEAMRVAGIACSEVAAGERVPQFTQEPRFGTALAAQELMFSEQAKPIAFTFSTATLGSMRPEPQDLSLPNSVPANLAEAVGAHEVGTAAELTEVLPESVQWISLGPSLVAKDTFSETLPETNHGLPLPPAPEARCDARQFATGADWQSTLCETQSAIRFAWYVIPTGDLTTALPKPLEETLEGRTELRADVIVSKVECRLPGIGELRYRLSGRIPAHFDRLVSGDSWFAPDQSICPRLQLRMRIAQRRRPFRSRQRTTYGCGYPRKFGCRLKSFHSSTAASNWSARSYPRRRSRVE